MPFFSVCQFRVRFQINADTRAFLVKNWLRNGKNLIEARLDHPFQRIISVSALEARPTLVHRLRMHVMLMSLMRTNTIAFYCVWQTNDILFISGQKCKFWVFSQFVSPKYCQNSLIFVHLRRQDEFRFYIWSRIGWSSKATTRGMGESATAKWATRWARLCHASHETVITMKSYFSPLHPEKPEEPYDARSLYERLKEQKDKKDLEFEETHKLSTLLDKEAIWTIAKAFVPLQRI